MVILEALTAGGLFAIYLPFLLIFAIFYALLAKTQVFGKEGKANKINAIVALIIAAYVAIFSPFAGTISVFFAAFFAQASVGLVVLLVFIMVVGLLLGPFVSTQEGWEKLGKKFIPIIVVVAFLFAIGLFLSSAGFSGIIEQFFGGATGGIGGFGLSGEDIALIVLIVITIAILFWLVGSEEPGRGIKLGIME
jgi:hypothetical protein